MGLTSYQKTSNCRHLLSAKAAIGSGLTKAKKGWIGFTAHLRACSEQHI
jgi:hypothetical protein